MTKTLVIGGDGYVGAAVADALRERGDDVSTCDSLDRTKLRRAMRGSERVFHTPELLSLRPADRDACFAVNTVGTRTVLEECERAGVERVVHTSSVAAIGPASRGGTADEKQLFTAGKLGIAYVNSKHEAEAEAMRAAAQGLPVVCVNPSVVLGPGGGNLVRRFMLGRIRFAVPGAVNVVDIRDLARAHLLADERGEVGERYIVGGRNFTWDRLFADLGRLSGAAPPPVRIPLAVALRMGRDDSTAASQWWTYRSTKARRELGWKPRPHEETLESCIAWWRDHGVEPAGRGLRGVLLAGVGRAMRMSRLGLA